MRQINLGMIGGGTVGSGVFDALQRNGGLLSSRLGVGVNLSKIAVKAFDEPRPAKIPESLMTTDWETMVKNPNIHMVAELAGGITIARTMVLTALTLGKPVITANKALLSAYGEEIFETARKHKTNVYFEASVAGGIPIIKSLREGFIGNVITHAYGIVNGTCNYILTRMKQEGADFNIVLKDAQKLGYAEAEPSLDIDGHDSVHKTGILASLAHGFWVDPKKIHVEGIRGIDRTDIQFADRLGFTIKLLAVIKKAPEPNSQNGARVQVSVCPTLIPNGHLMANVNHSFNAVFIRGDVVGDTLFYGRGAGKDPTASAVLSDLADAALDLQYGSHHRIAPFSTRDPHGEVLPMEEVVSRYYVRLTVMDRPGTLAKITAIFAETKIGISSVIQPEGNEGANVPLIFMTHEAPNAAMTRALTEIARLEVNQARPVMFRVENF
jgi:homoserine dehydrogenase